jgi:murein DD-endopeptidase MepM/ murein hydrolase activator NlpD
MRMAVSAISLILVLAALLPAAVRASGGDSSTDANVIVGTRNISTLPFLRPAMNIDPSPARGGGEVTIVDDSALMPEEGPSGTIADIEKPKNGTISLYVVREGDTLSGIAKMFSVTSNTILWANNLSRNATLKVGEILTILPVTGIKYTVKPGDSLATIAKHFGADATDIGSYNGVDDSSLMKGDEIIIPDGELAAPPAAPSTSHSTTHIGAEPAHNVGPRGDAAEVAYYIAPLVSYRVSQGIHGYNAVDLAAPKGSPIMASASGDVVVAREGGWNGGYGSYVVIQHDNGSQTLYGHMSKVAAYDGQHVAQGQVIGYVGSTGLATGPHVHFEIRNGIRNPFAN